MQGFNRGSNLAPFWFIAFRHQGRVNRRLAENARNNRRIGSQVRFGSCIVRTMLVLL
jgi:hypothetical protein